MGTRSDRKARPNGDTSRHTVVIDDPASMWAKLAWDVDVFRDVQVSYPDEKQPLAYAAINACIAAWSLRNWVENAAAGRAKDAGSKLDRKAFFAEVAKAIPGQAMCDAIANTAKHAALRDGEWPGGKVRLDYQEGDEDVPSGFIIYHVAEDGSSMGAALINLVAVCRDWRTYLSQQGYTDGELPLPEWHQNKLSRMFGDRMPQAPTT